MKEVIKSIFAFLISILPEETKTAEAETIAKIEELIESLDNKTEEEIEEVKNKITELAKLGGKFNELQNKFANINQKPKNQPIMNDVLKSKSYEDKFIAIFANQFIEPAERKAQFKQLQIENGLSDDEVLFPVRIAEGIRSRVMQDEFISKLTYFGIDNINVPVSLTENEAHRHLPRQTKIDAVIEFTKKTLTSSAIYAKYPIDYTTMRKASASLYAWVVDKLTQIVIESIEKSVLIGDDENFAFTAIIEEDDVYATHINGDEVNRDTVVAMVDAIQYRANDLLLVVDKPTLSALRREIVATGGTPAYIKKSDIAEMLGVSDIITRDYMSGGAVVFSPSAYGLVGDQSPEKIEQYDIKVNAHEIELVGVFGGALVEPKSASYIWSSGLPE